VATDDPPDRRPPRRASCSPQSSTGSYDVRDVMRAVVDDGELLELRAGMGTQPGDRARHHRRPTGGHRRQPAPDLAGTLDIPASQKGARFVAFCDAFNLPLVTLVDTPGFYPGKDLEWRGMIRKGAQLAFAYARATVPRIAVVMRKSYGGAYIVMDSKRMGNDLMFAWPSAEIAVMGARQAGEILHRRETPERRPSSRPSTRSASSTPTSPPSGARSTPSSSRPTPGREIAAGLEMLESKRERPGGPTPRQHPPRTEGRP
jgi:acetyl-CoA carboxylase carboxyltransferase component